MPKMLAAKPPFAFSLFFAAVVIFILAMNFAGYPGLAAADQRGDENPPTATDSEPEDGRLPRPLLPPANLPPRLDPLQVQFLLEHAEAGDPAMMCLYGLALLNGSAGRTDPAEAESWLRRSAEAGDDRGGFEYGKAWYQGLFSRKDDAEVLKWLLPAALRGDHEAAYYVGTTLLSPTDDSRAPDPVEGEKWLRNAAESGLGGAQADLGIAYYSGIGGVRQDYGEARRWFTLAAKQGSGDACNKLGVIYRHGYGVTADPERAILWFSLGVNLGDRYAAYNLANSYMNGEWVARNYPHAAQLHEMAASRGVPESMYYLGCLYAEGIGVTKNPGRAREWLVMADRSGHPDAAGLLDKLWEIDDDQPVAATPPVKVKALPLLREFSHTPLQKVDKGRVVLLEMDPEVTVAPGKEAGTCYLTVEGSPGVIFCEGEGLTEEGIRSWPVLRGVGAGFTGLSGFIRFEEVRQATAADLAEADGKGEAAVQPGAPAETTGPAAPGDSPNEAAEGEGGNADALPHAESPAANAMPE